MMSRFTSPDATCASLWAMASICQLGLKVAPGRTTPNVYSTKAMKSVASMARRINRLDECDRQVRVAETGARSCRLGPTFGFLCMKVSSNFLRRLRPWLGWLIAWRGRCSRLRRFGHRDVVVEQLGWSHHGGLGRHVCCTGTTADIGIDDGLVIGRDRLNNLPAPASRSTPSFSAIENTSRRAWRSPLAN